MEVGEAIMPVILEFLNILPKMISGLTLVRAV